MDPRQKLIVALDVSTAAAARKIVAAVGDSAVTYKVGLQLYTVEGSKIVQELISSGRQVFLDLKYHDIPNTVGAAVHEAAGLGVAMLTVHALGGQRMLRAATEAAGAVNPRVRVVAVTVLTSMDEPELAQVGIPDGILPEVMRLAVLAAAEGCHGVVASAQEASAIRKKFGDSFLIVTPGVRPEGFAHGDQARAVTPAQAIAAGASHIVVGRPIIEAADPAQAAREILAQMVTESVLSVSP
jgi:orotidine-5'-phosphate decarboxylase